MIEYSQIDVHIRGLIEKINRFNGIETLFSCSGHRLGESGYVTFRANEQQDLESLVRRLPSQWTCQGWENNRPFSVNIWVTVELMPGFGLTYSLRFQASPFYKQLELIEEMERGLT